MHPVILCALDHISSCIHARNSNFVRNVFRPCLRLIHARTFKLGMIGKLNQAQTPKPVCEYTISLRAGDHISGGIHARTFKLIMKHLYTIFRELDNSTKFEYTIQWAWTLDSCVLGTIYQAVYMPGQANIAWNISRSYLGDWKTSPCSSRQAMGHVYYILVLSVSKTLNYLLWESRFTLTTWLTCSMDLEILVKLTAGGALDQLALFSHNIV